MTPKGSPDHGQQGLCACGVGMCEQELGELLVGLGVAGRHQGCPGEKPNPGSLQAKLLLLTEPPAFSLQSLPAARGRGWAEGGNEMPGPRNLSIRLSTHSQPWARTRDCN